MRRVGLGVTCACFGVIVSLGCLNELAAALIPSWTPPEVQRSLRALHEGAGIAGWVVLQNAAMLIVTLALTIGGVGLCRGRASAASWTRRASIAFIGLSVINQIVLTATLYPRLLSAATSPPEPFPRFWLLTMIAAGFGLLFVPVAALHGLREAGAGRVSGSDERPR